MLQEALRFLPCVTKVVMYKNDIPLNALRLYCISFKVRQKSTMNPHNRHFLRSLLAYLTLRLVQRGSCTNFVGERVRIKTTKRGHVKLQA